MSTLSVMKYFNDLEIFTSLKYLKIWTLVLRIVDYCGLVTSSIQLSVFIHGVGVWGKKSKSHVSCSQAAAAGEVKNLESYRKFARG